MDTYVLVIEAPEEIGDFKTILEDLFDSLEYKIIEVITRQK